jgi:hypothetical protein
MVWDGEKWSNEYITCLDVGKIYRSGSEVDEIVMCTNYGRILMWDVDDVRQWDDRSCEMLQTDSINTFQPRRSNIVYYYPTYTATAYGSGWWISVGDNFINTSYYRTQNYTNVLAWSTLTYDPPAATANRFYFNNNTNIPITFNSAEFIDGRFYAVGGYTLNGADYGIVYYSDPVINNQSFSFNWKIAQVLDENGNPVDIDPLYAIAGVG